MVLDEIATAPDQSSQIIQWILFALAALLFALVGWVSSNLMGRVKSIEDKNVKQDLDLKDVQSEIKLIIKSDGDSVNVQKELKKTLTHLIDEIIDIKMDVKLIKKELKIS